MSPARLSKKEAEKLFKKRGKSIPEELNEEKKNKYNAQKTKLDGIPFDSIKEAQKYFELKQLKKEGKIKDFEVKPDSIKLLSDFFDRYGKKHRGITYKPDFLVYYHDGTELYLDTKGERTRDYILRKKLLLYFYPEIEFKEA